MEQLKVKKKDILVTNVIVYLGLAFLFLILQHAYRHHLSPFSLVYLRKSLELFWYIALPIIGSMFFLWRYHSYGLSSYVVCTCLITFKVIEGLFIEFNKIIVIALFFYVVISYFLYQLLAYYLSLASLNANYSQADLFEPLLKKIPCELSFDSKTYEGYLTNWDEDGCFVKLPGQLEVPAQVSLNVHFHGRDFTQNGEVVAQMNDLSGVGIKFEKLRKDLKVFNWSEFMEIIHELGYKPERLR